MVLDKLLVWEGTRRSPVRLDEVEAAMREFSRSCNRAHVVADRWQAIALVVFGREVGNAADGWVSDCGVHAVMVVAVEPVRKRPGSVRLAGVGPDVGPFVEQGPVEASTFPLVWGR